MSSYDYRPNLITGTDNEKHVFNPVLGILVDPKRPKPKTADYIDVVYDEGLVGNLEVKLFDRLTELLTGPTPQFNHVDLFFTDRGEYNSFIDMIFGKRYVSEVKSFYSSMDFAVTKTVNVLGYDSIKVLSLTGYPFSESSDGNEYFGLRVKLRPLLPESYDYIKDKKIEYHNQSWGFYTGGDLATLLKLGNSLAGVPDTDVIDNPPVPFVASKVNVERCNETLRKGDVSIIVTDEAEFETIYGILFGKPLNLDAGDEVKLAEYDTQTGLVTKIVYDTFTVFGKTYHVLKGYRPITE